MYTDFLVLNIFSIIECHLINIIVEKIYQANWRKRNWSNSVTELPFKVQTSISIWRICSFQGHLTNKSETINLFQREISSLYGAQSMLLYRIVKRTRHSIRTGIASWLNSAIEMARQWHSNTHSVHTNNSKSENKSQNQTKNNNNKHTRKTL